MDVRCSKVGGELSGMSGTGGGGGFKHTRGNVVVIPDDDLNSSSFKDAGEERFILERCGK